MKKCLLIIALLISGLAVFSQTQAELDAKRIKLPSGWALSPVGSSLQLDDLPLNLMISPNGKLAAVSNCGQSVQSIQLIDVDNYIELDRKKAKVVWYGLAFSSDSKTLYASGGNGNYILQFDVSKNKLQPLDTIKIDKPWPVEVSVAGIAVDDKRKLLFAVTKENNSLYIIDLATKKITNKLSLPGEAYACILSPDKKILYISCWGCDKIVLFDTNTQTIKGNILVGDNPNEIILNKKGNLLFVANSNDNSVSIIDIAKLKVIETLNCALYPNAPSGSTTNGLALSNNEETLYIANADNNCLAVFDVKKPGESKSKGFIPVGWYPTSVRIVNKSVWVTNGKGFSSFPNPNGPNPIAKKEKVIYQQGDTAKIKDIEYIGGLFKGTLSRFSEPDIKQLSVYSQAVYKNTPYNKERETLTSGIDGNPIPYKLGDVSPIKHIFYIIKENRTYDQVLGDLEGGNGDTSLVLFGRKITPNQHALAEQFVLLDNFYVDGEVSADGHNWSTGAYATDFLEKNWPSSYGGRGGHYYGEGTREVANNKNGFIWDYCKRYGVSYRTYGEFVDDYKPNIPAIKDHFCTYYTDWDESVMDTTRFGQWKRDFDSLLLINKVPQFNSLRFINDHTEGLRIDRPTPFAHVADNDLAVGLFVDYLSKSSIWGQSVVFIIEDDAQNGPDHVDAHRSTAYLAGGMVKRKFVDHTMYSTSSMLRTMELILGIPPMSQYDAAAEPMWRCFNNTPDNTGFNHLSPQVNLFEKNTVYNKWQRKSESFDFSKEDRVADADFNAVLWFAVKGDKSPCPPPKRAAFFNVNAD